MAYTVQDEPDRTIPEDTIVRAQLIEVEEKDIEWADKNTGEKKTATLLEWWWEVIDKRAGDGLYEGRKVKGSCNAKLSNHERNQFRQWTEALLNRELGVGQSVDPPEDLVGLKADITVSHREYTSKGEKRIAEDVDEVIPVRGHDDEDVPF